MALCKNRRCMKQLGDSHWGEGYCSRRCMATAPGYDPDESAPLMDPTDPTGQWEICKNLDEVDFMMRCAEIHPQLPKMLYLKKKKKSLRQIAEAVGMNHMQVSRLISVTKTL